MRVLTVLVAVASMALTVSAQAEKWRFIVAGDGRADPKAHRPEDKNGINTLITGEICQAVQDEHAKCLFWTGDLVLGYAKDPKEFEQQLFAWRDIMKPLYDKHIGVFPCRGNHDAASTDSWNVWDKVFTGRYANPKNGPASEKNLTFYYTHGDVIFFGLDQYTQAGEAINQPWLDSVLAANKRPFVFSMGHEPAFMDGAHKDTMDASPGKRDTFISSMIRAGSRVFFCGHDHFYDHMTVTHNGHADADFHQVTAGTSGAPFYAQGQYAGSNAGWQLHSVKHFDKTYGYIVVEIDGKKATVTFKGRTAPGKYEAMDQFSFSVK